MQASGISPNLVRVLASTASNLLAEMFSPGKVLDAEVISLFQDRAMLSFGKGIRLEVALQAPLREGQRVRLQVQPRQQGGSLVLKLVPPAAQVPAQPAAQAPAQPAAPTPAQQAAPTPAQQAAPTPAQQAAQAPAQPAEQAPAQPAAPAAAQPGMRVPVQPATAMPPQQAAATPAQPAAQAAFPPAAPVPVDQVDPQRLPTSAAPASDPALLWIPIPLEAGKQGWACLRLTENESRPSVSGKPAHQVRLWWETPALGQVQVNLENAGESLTALFIVLAASARQGLEQGLSELQDRLSQAGFADVLVRCRQAAPGEALAPVAASGRLDRRI